MIYTVGYSALIHEWDNRKEDIIMGLTEIISTYQAVIIDIRSNPHGLINIEDLEKHLNKRYISAPKLGDPMYPENYLDHRFPHRNICLMCVEKNHLECHRDDLAKLYSVIRKEGIVHLFSSAYDVDGSLTEKSKALICEKERLESQKVLF